MTEPTSSRPHDAEQILGHELGADDYGTKPFNPRELRARIKAVLRRVDGHGDDGADVYRFGEVEVDFTRADVRRGGQPVALSALEFRLLGGFVRSRGRLLTRDQLLDAARGPNITLNDRVVDNHIIGLRRKLEADPSSPRHFMNIRGLGYRFDA